MTKAAELAKMGEVITNGQIGGRRNIIINGAMNVAQRATSATGLGASSGYYVVDRVNFGHSGNSAGRYTATQESITDLGGFNNALKLACTTADTSIASDEWERLVFNLEAQDLQSLRFGNSDAKKFTVSFYVKGNASATYTLGAQSADSNRWMAKTFNVTTSWNRVSVTFEADTSGAINDDTGHGIVLYITLQAGSDRTSGEIPSTWETLSAADTADSNQTMFFDSTDRTFFITGLQMEVGSQATPFEHRSFGDEKKLCERYYFQTQSQNFAGVASATNRLIAGYRIPDMRATPSFTFISYNGTTARLSKATNNADTTFSSASVTSLNGFYQVTSSSNTFVAGEGYFAQLKCDSEL
tara:strand:+ start:34 stop:1101 length:1068 start_codon:yes stop_codon:yes gene_type:complete